MSIDEKFVFNQLPVNTWERSRSYHLGSKDYERALQRLIKKGSIEERYNNFREIRRRTTDELQRMYFSGVFDKHR